MTPHGDGRGHHDHHVHAPQTLLRVLESLLRSSLLVESRLNNYLVNCATGFAVVLSAAGAAGAAAS